MARKIKLVTNKRAITPVLSSLLLTVVAVSAMALATTATYVITTNLRENMSERFIIEDVWFTSPVGIAVYVRNIGKVAIRISAVYINQTRQFFTPHLTLEIEGHGWLNVSDFAWDSGSVYYIDVVTNRGNHVASYYKAP